MKELELNISALNTSASSPGNYVMVLKEISGNRKIAIIIGLQEAQAIAVSLEQMQPVRPLTHDLLLNTIAQLNATLQQVKICDFTDGTFISAIVIKDSNQNILEIDSRTSDAIALATRQKCPIYIKENLLNELAIAETFEQKESSDKKENMELYSLEELYAILSSLLAKEDYENASGVRDIIFKKEKEQL